MKIDDFNSEITAKRRLIRQDILLADAGFDVFASDAIRRTNLNAELVQIHIDKRKLLFSRKMKITNMIDYIIFRKSTTICSIIVISILVL